MAESKDLAPISGEIVPANMPELHENLKKVVHTIDNLIADQHAANIMAMWRVGQLLHEVDTNPDNYLTEDQRSRHVAPSALLLQAYDRVYTADQFSTAIRLHESYPSEAAITALVDRRCPTKPNWRLTASHVQMLLTVPDDNQRKIIADRCVKEAYTTKALAVELSELHGKEKKAREPKAPKGLKQQVYDLLEHQRKFIARSEKLWTSDDGLYDTIMSADPSKLTDTIRGYLLEIRENFAKLQHLAEIQHALCGRIAVHIQNNGADAQPESEDSEDDAAPAVSARKVSTFTR